MRRSSVGALALLLSLALWAAGVTGAQGDPLHNVRAVKLTMPEPGEAADRPKHRRRRRRPTMA